MRPHRPMEAPIIYLTKYIGREVGERSVGLHPDIANDVAAMLRAAVALCRDPVEAVGNASDAKASRPEGQAT